MKKAFQYNCMIACFVLLLVLPAVSWGVLRLASRTRPELMEALDFDTGENRALAAFPDTFTGNSYTAELEAYYKDHLPFRAAIMAAMRDADGAVEGAYRNALQPVLIDILYGDVAEESEMSLPDEASGEPEEEEEAVLPSCENGHTDVIARVVEASYYSYGHTEYVCEVCGRERIADFEPKLVDTSYYPLSISAGQTILGRYDRLFYRGDDSLAYYQGDNLYSEEEMAQNLALMQELQDACAEKGKELVFMVFPNKELVYPEYMPTINIVSDVKRHEAFGAYLAEHSSIRFLYPLKELQEGKLYFDTYYAYDTHWNNVGAFLATQQLYRELGVQTTELTEVPRTPTNLCARALIPTGNLRDEDYGPDVDYDLAYKPEVTLYASEGEKSGILGYSTKYTAQSAGEDKRRLTLVGDSFRVWMIQYLEKDFADICLVQRENIAEAEQEIKEADILVVTTVERFDKYMFSYLPILTDYIREAP